MVSALIGF